LELAEQFEQHRDHLERIAYRMLGSHSDAEDAVQEGWLRLSRSDSEGIDNLAGWLTTVVARVCLDMLRRRRELVGDEWLPEPVLALEEGPEEQAVLADSVGVALLVVLETLTPPERLAFVLHDLFAVPFEEIAAILDRTPAAARQLASRARRRVRGGSPLPDADIVAQRRVVEAFLAASQRGDFDALVEILAPDAVLRVRGGGQPPDEAHGADEIAGRVLARGSRFAHLGRPALVNGSIGVLVGPIERPISVVAMSIDDGRIASIDIVVAPTIER
jgi:RNA polymerase sigma-70 factor (ECF subfamily)